MLKLISYLSLLCFMLSCVTPPEAESPSTKKLAEGPYAKKLRASKATYPFERWKELYANGLTQYTEANCNACKEIFDGLIEDLIDAGENAQAETKLAIFKKAILKTNVLNEQCDMP
jgi:protein-disulfide isomerase